MNIDHPVTALEIAKITLFFKYVSPRGGGGLLPYIGMFVPKGYGFSAVLVINGVSILADFGHKWGIVLYSNLDIGICLSREATFQHYRKENQQIKSPSQIMFTVI